MNKKIGLKGTFSLEYAVLIVILITALLAASTYIQRAICGRLRTSGDVFGGGRQYQY
jgi:Flp pilus assembly pilin Flp